MIETTIAFFCSFFIGYYSKKSFYLSTLDPLQILSVQEGAWVATVVWLFEFDAISINQVLVFATCIVCWWFVWFTSGILVGNSYKNNVCKAIKKLKTLDNHYFNIILFIYLFAAITFTVFSLILGGGDNRISILKLLRPLEGFTSLLEFFVIFKLLIKKNVLSKYIIFFIFLTIIITNGKSAVLIFLLPICAAQLSGEIKLTLKSYLYLLIFIVFGFSLSVSLNYNDRDLNILDTLINRMFVEGDIYKYVFADMQIDNIKVENIFFYTISPIIKFLMLPIELDQNIGSQIGSNISNTFVVTGPNGHWPVLLLAANFEFSFNSIIITLIFFGISVFIKLYVLSNKFFNKRIYFLIPILAFSLKYPQTSFSDPSNQFIYLIHAMIVGTTLYVLFKINNNERTIHHNRIPQ